MSRLISHANILKYFLRIITFMTTVNFMFLAMSFKSITLVPGLLIKRHILTKFQDIESKLIPSDGTVVGGDFKVEFLLKNHGKLPRKMAHVRISLTEKPYYSNAVGKPFYKREFDDFELKPNEGTCSYVQHIIETHFILVDFSIQINTIKYFPIQVNTIRM